MKQCTSLHLLAQTLLLLLQPNMVSQHHILPAWNGPGEDGRWHKQVAQLLTQIVIFGDFEEETMTSSGDTFNFTVFSLPSLS